MKNVFFCLVLLFVMCAAISAQALDLGKEADYVGSKNCKECHRDTYYGWKTTMHPYKIKVIDPDIIIGDFVENNTFQVSGETITMERKGDDYFITAPTGTTNELKTHQIKYVIGGFWKQRYVTVFPNGALHILPIQWNVKTKEWVDYHGLAKRKPETGKGYWSDGDRVYQIKCMGCHTTGSDYDHDTATNTFTNTTWVDTGVACEACHGPGSLHVKAPVDKKLDTIINPAKLPDDRRAVMVCGSCHTRGKSKDGKHGYPTRGLTKTGTVESPIHYCPGDDMNYQYVEKPGMHPDFSPAKHHQQHIDWVKSGHATAGVACWDCHSPHKKGNANKKQLKLPGSLLCVSCHTNVAKIGVHGLHSTNSCIGCHMPDTAKTATPFDISAHTMKVIQPKLTIANKKQPNSCTLCHYHKDHSLVKLQEALDKTKTLDAK